MLKILPIMLLSSAKKLPIMLNFMLININDATVRISIKFTGINKYLACLLSLL